MQMEPLYQIMNNHFRLKAEFSFSGTGSAAFCMQLIINLKNYHFSEPYLHYLLSVIKVFISQVINEGQPPAPSQCCKIITDHVYLQNKTECGSSVLIDYSWSFHVLSVYLNNGYVAGVPACFHHLAHSTENECLGFFLLLICVLIWRQNKGDFLVQANIPHPPCWYSSEWLLLKGCWKHYP